MVGGASLAVGRALAVGASSAVARALVVAMAVRGVSLAESRCLQDAWR